MFSSVLTRRVYGTTRVILKSRCLSKKYKEAYAEALKNREEFWAKAAEELTWVKKWDKTLDHSNPPFTKWFVGGQFSHCYNALDRHVENGKGSRVAIIHDSPVTGSISKVTYAELLEQVSLLAGVLSKHGVAKGDRVLIYMPMIPQAIMSMLATVRLGGIHALVFGGFAAKELSARISSCKPKIVICASYGIEPSRLVEYKPVVDQAIAMSDHKPLKTLVYQRPNFDLVELNGENDLDWEDQMLSASHHDCVAVESNHPLYLLYTSGTTGIPKAVVRPTAGHSVALNWSMYNVYGVLPGEVYWAAADLGWSVGHSYGCHAIMLCCNTTVLYEGKPVGTPDASSFFRVISEHNVVSFFAATTAFRVIKREDPEGILGRGYDMSSLRSVFVGGEHCDTDTAEWASKAFNAPVLNHWWQTETGHPMSATCIGLDCNVQPPPGTTGLPVPGWDIRVVDDEMNDAKPGVLGSIIVNLPLNPGVFQSLWEDDKRYVDTYFKKYPGYYDTMDAGMMHEEGFLTVSNRTDDVINVAGHRLSCGQIEEVICSHKAVIESAVVAKTDEVKGTVPFAFVILNTEYEGIKDEVLKELVQLVRDTIGPVAAFKDAKFVNRLPKTRSGKIPRKTLQALINGQLYKIPPTVEDESVYEELEELLRKGKVTY